MMSRNKSENPGCMLWIANQWMLLVSIWTRSHSERQAMVIGSKLRLCPTRCEIRCIEEDFWIVLASDFVGNAWRWAPWRFDDGTRFEPPSQSVCVHHQFLTLFKSSGFRSTGEERRKPGVMGVNVIRLFLPDIISGNNVIIPRHLLVPSENLSRTIFSAWAAEFGPRTSPLVKSQEESSGQRMMWRAEAKV